MHLLYILYSIFALLLVFGIGTYLLRKASPNSSKAILYLLLLAAPSIIFLPVSLNLFGMLYHHCRAFLLNQWDKPVSIGVAAVIILLTAWVLVKEMRRVRWENKVGMQIPYQAHHKAFQTLEELKKEPLFSSFRNALVRVVPSERPFAFVLGIGQPRIYLSEWLVESLTEEELKGVLAHEMAHLEGKDHYLFGLARFFRGFGFFIPWVEKAWKSLQMERELRADSIASHLVGSQVPIASALLKSWEKHLSEKEIFSARLGLPFMGEDVQLLEKRLDLLLQESSSVFTPTPGIQKPWLLLISVIMASPYLVQFYLFSAPFCH